MCVCLPPSKLFCTKLGLNTRCCVRWYVLLSPQVFGNRIGVCYVPMFLAETDPVKRVADVSQLLSRLKRSAQPLVSYALL